MRRHALLCLTLILVYRSPCALAAPSQTESFRQPGSHSVETVKYDWHDSARDRDLPVRIYYPATGKGPFPVIVFSHGLGGSRDGYEFLGRYWASHGYVCVHLTHIGSDTSVLKGNKQSLEAMRKAAADLKNALNRPKDVSFALDRLPELNRGDSKLKGRLAVDRIGLAGHSFGGYTTLASAGETFIGPRGRDFALGDPRLKAAIAMSAPAKPRDRATLDQEYGSIKIPLFVMTGTKDDSPIGDSKAEDRRIPFDHLSGIEGYLLILNGGDHMVFSGRDGPTRDKAQDGRFHSLILISSTAFWDAYLKDDASAKTWLANGGFAQALGSDGTFEKKDR